MAPWTRCAHSESHGQWGGFRSILSFQRQVLAQQALFGSETPHPTFSEASWGTHAGSATQQEGQVLSLPGNSPQAHQAKLLTLNESLVLLSGCLQMTPMVITLRRAVLVTTRIAHSSPLPRASLPITATMHTVRMKITKGRQTESHFASPHRYPRFSPKPVQRVVLTIIRTEKLLLQSQSSTKTDISRNTPTPCLVPLTRQHAIPTSKTPDPEQEGTRLTYEAG